MEKSDIVYDNKSSFERKLILDTSKKAAQLILQNGGETYRAEDTCRRICMSCGAVKVDVWSVTTGIVLSVEFADSESGVNHFHTTVARVPFRITDLKAIEKTNQISRELSAGTISVEKANKEFDAMLNSLEYPKKPSFAKKCCSALGPGFASAFFCLLFGGGIHEFFVSFISAWMTAFLAHLWDEHLRLYTFITTFLSSIITACFCMLFTAIYPALGYNFVIIGVIMPLVPGIAITNAVRDTMNGDLVSGSVRLIEALLIAIAIAAGFGFIMGFAMQFGII